MNTELEQLRGYRLQAEDGEIGHVRDLLIEEDTWTARWVVVDTGKWLPGRKVILSPVVFGDPDTAERVLPVHLTGEQIEQAPSLDEDSPVSREIEKAYFDHYQWPYYWEGSDIWGGGMTPRELNVAELEGLFRPELAPEEKEHLLRSGHEMTKYRLVCGEDKLGYMEDLLLETNHWSVKALQFDTRKWFHGKTLRISPSHITRISWQDHSIYVDALPEDPEKTEEAPVHPLYGIPIS